MKKRLFTPGPTPIPDAVSLRMVQPIFHHRTPLFRELLEKTTQKLQYIFQTDQPVYIFTGSGTGAMEAAVANLFQEGDTALTIESGKFSERWGDLCEAYRIPVVRHQIEWGKSLQPEELKDILKQQNRFKVVFVTHSETSTGAVIDLKRIAAIVHQYSSALLVVDGITSVGALPLKMDEWGLDVVISGSQKGFMCPPGLAFIACSKRAMKAVREADRPRFYFDLRKYGDALRSKDTPFTPATTLINALDQALDMMCEEGLDRIWKRHHQLASATRAAVQALGLKLFPQYPSDALTVVAIPESLSSSSIIDEMKNNGAVIAGGQGKLRGKIFRIAHLGFFDRGDLITLISILENVLINSGWQCSPGIGVKTFQTNQIS